jgi:flagellar biosynthetic protein FlhB
VIGEERVHPATPRRREEARREGVIPRSADLTRAAALLAAAVAVALVVEPLGRAAAAWLRGSLGSIGRVSVDDAAGLLRHSLGSASLWMLPVFAAVLVTAFVVQGLQTGFAWSPRFGFRGGVPAERRAGAVAWALLKFSVLVAVAAWTLHQRLPSAAATGLAASLGGSVAALMFRLSLAFLLLGLADYALERRRHEADLRMTTQELRDEQRAGDGDPRLKKRRRVLMRNLIARD